jgi:MoxR-like ATPase
VVTCDDVRAAARPILRHRMFTNFTADSEGMDTDKIVQKLLETIAEPGEKDYAGSPWPARGLKNR